MTVTTNVHPNDTQIFIPAGVQRIFGADIGILYVKDATTNLWVAKGTPTRVYRDLHEYCEKAGDQWIYTIEPGMLYSMWHSVADWFTPQQTIVGYPQPQTPPISALDQQYESAGKL